jgi:CheY-like chemotaxis protein
MPSFQEPIDIGIVSRKKVLVAEDEANIAALIDDWLSDVYEVTVASNGKAALQKAKWTNPDIILMDVVMPDMGGYEVIRALLSDTATNRIPIIAMSAQNFDDSTIKLIKGEINVMGFINKPFKPDVLKSTIAGGGNAVAGAACSRLPRAGSGDGNASAPTGPGAPGGFRSVDRASGAGSPPVVGTGFRRDDGFLVLGLCEIRL